MNALLTDPGQPFCSYGESDFPGLISSGEDWIRIYVGLLMQPFFMPHSFYALACYLRHFGFKLWVFGIGNPDRFIRFLIAYNLSFTLKQ